VAVLPPHQLDPAIASLRRAFEYYVEAGDTGRAIAVAAHPLPLSLRFGYTDAAELSARALTLVSPDSHEAGALLAQHGWFSGFIEADYDDAQRAFHQALSIAERDEDAALERRTLQNAAFVDAFHLRWRECLARGLPAVELARHAGDPHTEIPARRAVAFSLAATGEGEEARFHTSAALVHAKQLHESWWLTSTTFSNELLCLYQGDWRTAREMSELGLAAAPRDPRHLALRAVLEYELGNYDESAIYITWLREVAESVPPPGPIADHVLLAAAIPLVERTASAERLDAAEGAADRVLALPRLAPALATYARSGLALIAVQRRDADAAERQYAALKEQTGTASFFVPLTFDRLFGWLALTLGEVDAAVAHFAEGLAFCDRAGYRTEYAWTVCDYAGALLLRRRAEDSGRAVALEEESLAIARELGMRPLMERVLASRGST
jgi:tetratricopeptide (TPR) repeat protein